MSENPTARFAPAITCYEYYESFQIETQLIKKKLAEMRAVLVSQASDNKEN